MSKPRTTKTLGPLHFEDLEPHRFEDLVRELVYDFRDWQTIEATGRSGSDEGWDIRGYERAAAVTSEPVDDEEFSDVVGPMAGNAWMIQVKREKTLGPSDVKRIVLEVDSTSPPYGFILAAPVNFSKKAYDAFRAGLREKGVSEFYMWGRAELEDMLHMPKNDRVLFTFFGISLVTRRRSRSTEVRAAIAAKNKLYRVVGEGADLHKEILLRDLGDTYYPFKDDSPDFAAAPRWLRLTAAEHHPLGLVVEQHHYYAYLDKKKHEWDYTPAVDLVELHHSHSLRADDDEKALRKKQRHVLERWEQLPKACQVMFEVYRLVRYDRIAAIDEKGDVSHDCPHIFVDFAGGGPFDARWEWLKVGAELVRVADDLKRVEVFPKTFAPEPFRAPSQTLTLAPDLVEQFSELQDCGVLFATDDRFARMQEGEVFEIDGLKTKYGGDLGVRHQVTHVERLSVAEYLREAQEHWKLRAAMKSQVGAEVGDDEVVTCVEYRRYYKRPDERE